jgi:hypothetical protein
VQTVHRAVKDKSCVRLSRLNSKPINLALISGSLLELPTLVYIFSTRILDSATLKIANCVIFLKSVNAA